MPETNTEADKIAAEMAAGMNAIISEALVDICMQLVSNALNDMVRDVQRYRIPDSVAVPMFRVLAKRAESCAQVLEAEAARKKGRAEAKRDEPQ